jgi:hypothetical protein
MTSVKLTGSFVSIDQSNINTNKTSVQQLVDIVQTDISSVTQSTRKSYEVFTSGGVNQEAITSSLFQTVYDQEFNLGTSNPLFDISIGSFLEKTVSSGNTVLDVNGLTPTQDGGGKLIFTNSEKTPMMREKVNVYRQFAQNLLGNADSSFFLPHDATSEDTLTTNPDNFLTRNKKIRGAIFICFRRLFTRDNIKKGTVGLRLFKKSNRLFSEFVSTTTTDRVVGSQTTNIDTEITQTLSGSDTQIITDVLSATNLTVSPVAGEVSTLTDPSGNKVGVIFYDSGIVVLDVERVFDSEQYIRGEINSTRQTTKTFDANGPFAIWGRKSGENAGAERWYYPVYTANDSASSRIEISSFTPVDTSDVSESSTVSWWYHNSGDNQINSVNGSTTRPASGLYPVWSSMTSTQRTNYYLQSGITSFEYSNGKTLHNGKLYPSLWVSGTVDGVLDHICNTRFGRGNISAITFRNETVINSSLIFCRAAPSQLNYSTNPTFTNSDGEIVTVDRDDPNSNSFCFITTVGLYDASGDLLAVAKTSRPIEKNPETDLSIRIRLDY